MASARPNGAAISWAWADPRRCASTLTGLPCLNAFLRNWTKKTGFGRSVLMSREDVIKGEDLVELVDEAARQISGEILS